MTREQLLKVGIYLTTQKTIQMFAQVDEEISSLTYQPTMSIMQTYVYTNKGEKQ